MAMKKEKEIKKITEQIIKKYKPEKIILFGSYAWGKPGPDSDVDLFIIKKTTKKRWDRERELRLKIFPPILPIDLLIYTPKELKKRSESGDFFVNGIIGRGKVLYEQTK